MLYLVGTPIGNLSDITLRALETLKVVDVIACEDTRVSSKLLHHYGISKPRLSYHDHNAEKMRPKLLGLLKSGKSLAYITDGGMPLVSDPGYKLIVACQVENLPYTVIPGPSAPITALCFSGISPDSFFFCGFLSSKQKARKEALLSLKTVQASLIFFEAPQRLVSFLKDAADILGDRTGAVCREMTKLYEEVKKGPLPFLQNHYDAHPPRGEIVIVIEGASSHPSFTVEDLEAELQKLLQKQTVKEATQTIAKKFGLSKREVYQRALSLKSKEKGLS